MNINDIKIGDILDAYIEGESAQRIIIINKNEDDNLVFGLNTNNGKIIDINPENQIESIIANINDLLLNNRIKKKKNSS